MSELADHMWAVVEAIAHESKVPGLGVICTLAHEVHRQSQEIDEHKQEIALLTGRVYTTMLIIISRKDSKPEQAQLDRLQQLVERLQEDVITWKHYGKIGWRIKSHKVNEKLKAYKTQFDAAVDDFHLSIDLDTNAAYAKAEQLDAERWKAQEQWHRHYDNQITTLRNELECAAETIQAVQKQSSDGVKDSDNSALLAQKWVKDDVWDKDQIKRLEVHIFQGEDLRLSLGKYAVHTGSFKSGPQYKLVIKELLIKNASERTVKRVIQQADLLSNVRHANIVTFLGTTSQDPTLTLITKFCERGNVMQYLQEEPAADRLRIVKEVIKGLQHLHSLEHPHSDRRGYIHLNIKPSNVLITRTGTAQIDSFDYAKEMGPDVDFSATMTSNNLRWRAPETFLRGGKVDTSTDIYAWAVTAVFILTGLQPFKDLADDTIGLKDVELGPPATKEIYFTEATINNIVQRSLEMGVTTSDVNGIWELLHNSWAVKKEERPSAADIVSALLSLRKVPSITST